VGWKIFDEAVDMVEQRFGYLPDTFRWRGHDYEVEAVERSWTVSRPGWKRPKDRRYFQVRCWEGTFELCQNLGSGAWHLRRAKLARVRAVPVRRAVPVWR
jgi:hypothetical protein